jgi:hypothetical protein
MQKLVHNIGLWEKRQFFPQKIVENRWNIDLWSPWQKIISQEQKNGLAGKSRLQICNVFVLQLNIIFLPDISSAGGAPLGTPGMPDVSYYSTPKWEKTRKYTKLT